MNAEIIWKGICRCKKLILNHYKASALIWFDTENIDNNMLHLQYCVVLCFCIQGSPCWNSGNINCLWNGPRPSGVLNTTTTRHLRCAPAGRQCWNAVGWVGGERSNRNEEVINSILHYWWLLIIKARPRSANSRASGPFIEGWGLRISGLFTEVS